MNVRQIAKLAKVSTATVSRAINRVPTVDPVLARRVWRVIDEVGYYPNTHARTLARGHSRIVGVMVSETINRFFSEMVQKFAELCAQHDYDLLLRPISQDSRQLDIAARRIIERRIDGVAVLTFWPQERLIESFLCNQVPVFAIESASTAPQLRTLSIDYSHGIRQAVQHLAALGHAHIAFVGGPRNFRSALEREIAFEASMHEINLPPQQIVGGDHTMEAGMAAMLEFSRLQDRPSAVVCSNDTTAIGVMHAAFDLGLSIPRDLSVIGVDDIRLSRFMSPPLTTVELSQTEIASVAFRELLGLMEVPSKPSLPVTHSIKTNLILRSSTGLAPDRARQMEVHRMCLDDRNSASHCGS
ncbi:MAG TPA: LacI family DNA-binding transcriptional regulator [Terriglobales bacterium]|nr:LacI family DNA-binding transcriptional regulator [Terriglobales bacterium]